MATTLPTDFRGTARPLDAGAIARAARRLDCAQAAVRAVVAVESRGGFDAQGRPALLFERHYFHRLTQGRFSAIAPAISQPRAGGYGPARLQYHRLAQALELDREAALRSASWGAFQIMGDNHALCGHRDVTAFVAALCEDEGAHLDAFVSFVLASGLAPALRRRDWAGFARGYNGPAYRRNRYDEKLARAYAARIGTGAVLAFGARGEAVVHIQQRLSLAPDGIFGPLTRAAVRAFQAGHALAVDGIVGPRTLAALFG